jgi:hypothetical protein
MAPLERFFSARSSFNDPIEWQPEEDVLEAADLWADSQSSVPFPQNKKVQFCGTVTIVRIISKKSLPSNIKATMWYHKRDYARFRDSCRELQERALARSHHYPSTTATSEFDDEENCSRGLEKFSRNGTYQYMERYKRMMNDFYLVRITGGSPDEISRLLTAHSNVCRQEALERARKDERDALLYQMKTLSSSDTVLISNLLPKARDLLDRQAHSSVTEETKTSNSTTSAAKSSYVMASTSARARQMRQQRLSASRW